MTLFAPHLRRSHSRAAAIIWIASLAAVQPGQAAPPTKAPQSAQAKGAAVDDDLRRDVQKLIEDCIRDKVTAPAVCRQIAYASALAVGFPPDEAARITGHREDARPKR